MNFSLMDSYLTGAITSKPFAFLARIWELEALISIDVFDSLNHTVILNIRFSKVLRILPAINNDICNNLITNRIRFANDGFLTQRITEPLFKINNLFIPVNWITAVKIFKKNISNSFVEYFFGRVIDRETIISVYILLSKYYYSPFSKNNVDSRQNFLIEKNFIKNIDIFDYCLFVGLDFKKEHSIFESIIKQQKSKVVINSISCNINNFYTKNYGNTVFDFFQLLEGKNFISKKFKKFFNPIIIFGFSFMRQIPTCFITKFSNIYKIFPFNSFGNIINVSDLAVGSRGFFKKIYSVNKSIVRFIYLISNDIVCIDFEKKIYSFIVYQGSHGYINSAKSNLVLPGCIFTEKFSSYRNLFGELRKTYFVNFPPNQARVDWKIVISMVWSKSFSGNITYIMNEICPNKYLVLFNTINFKFNKIILCNFIEKFLFNGLCVDAITFHSKPLNLMSQVSKNINFIVR